MRRHDEHPGRATVTRRRAAATLAFASLVGLVAAHSAARAQVGEPRVAQPASAPSPLAPGDLVVMDFQDVEIATLVKFISEITGRNFLLDDKVKGKVSVISPSKITVDEA